MAVGSANVLSRFVPSDWKRFKPGWRRVTRTTRPFNPAALINRSTRFRPTKNPLDGQLLVFGISARIQIVLMLFRQIPLPLSVPHRVFLGGRSPSSIARFPSAAVHFLLLSYRE